jgi:protein TonB
VRRKEREMFDRLIESTSERRNARTWGYFLVSFCIWALVLMAIGVGGILAYDAQLNLPGSLNDVAVYVPSPPPPPPAPRRGPVATTPTPTPAAFVARVPSETIPPPAPPTIPAGSNLPNAIDGGGSETGVTGGLPGATGNGPSTSAGNGRPDVRPPPPPPQPRQTVDETVRQDRPRTISRVITGLAVTRVEPVYPEIARRMRVTGSVVVEVTISEEGSVISAKAISGHPLLRDAAIRAARQWRFTPTILGGSPVRVMGTITFNFKM